MMLEIVDYVRELETNKTIKIEILNILFKLVLFQTTY